MPTSAALILIGSMRGSLNDSLWKSHYVHDNHLLLAFNRSHLRISGSLQKAAESYGSRISKHLRFF